MMKSKQLPIRPNLMVSFKVAEIHPNIICIAMYDEELNKWSNAILKGEEGKEPDMNKMERGEYIVLFSSEQYIYDSEKEAIENIMKVVDDILYTVKTMSN